MNRFWIHICDYCGDGENKVASKHIFSYHFFFSLVAFGKVKATNFYVVNKILVTSSQISRSDRQSRTCPCPHGKKKKRKRKENLPLSFFVPCLLSVYCTIFIYIISTRNDACSFIDSCGFWITMVVQLFYLVLNSMLKSLIGLETNYMRMCSICSLYKK